MTNDSQPEASYFGNPEGTCEVSFGLGRTLDLGNYESARVDVRLQVRCDQAELRQTWRRVRQWVAAQLDQQCAKAKGEGDHG